MSGIFICHRRDDSRGFSHAIHNQINQNIKTDQVFLDIATILPGEDYLEKLENSVSECAVFIVLIGPDWLDIKDENGNRRLDNPKDPIRSEVEMALNLEITTIPVLLPGATMPSVEELPESIKQLHRLQAITIGENFGIDVQVLIDTINAILEEKFGKNKLAQIVGPSSIGKFLTWIFRLVGTVLVVLTMIAASLVLLGSFGLSKLIETALVNGNLVKVEPGVEEIINLEEAEFSIQEAARLFLPGSIQDVTIGLTPPDQFAIQATTFDRLILIECSQTKAGDYIDINIESINGIRPYLVGNIISGGFNRGLRAVLDEHELSIDTINMNEENITILFSGKPTLSQDVETTPTPTPIPLLSLGEPPLSAIQVITCGSEGIDNRLCASPLYSTSNSKVYSTNDIQVVGEPTWKPDGTQIVFAGIEQSDSSGNNHHIYTINAEGGQLVEIPLDGSNHSPSWSPDGEWLTFRKDGNLAIMHPDGSELAMLWQNDSENSYCAGKAQWSPDSQNVVLSMYVGDCEASLSRDREIWVVPINGSEIKKITAITCDDNLCINTLVAFNPDGTQIAYIDPDQKTWLATIDGSGSKERLSKFPDWWTNSVYPQWGKNKTCGKDETELFFENFGDQEAQLWWFYDHAGETTDTWSILESNGNHYIAGASSKIAEFGNPRWEDITFYAIFKRLTATSNAQISIRDSTMNDGKGRYYFDIEKGNVIREHLEENTILSLGQYSPDYYWHLLKIQLVGGHIAVYIDNELVVEADDPEPLPAGMITIENINGTVQFDEILVCGNTN